MPDPYPTTPTDEPNPGLDDLLPALGRGDESALDEIYDLMSDAMYGLALWRSGSAQEAADAVQETFIRLAQAARKGKLDRIRNARAYLLTMTRRATVDQIRRRPKHESLEALSSADLLLPQAGDDPSISVDAALACRRLADLPGVQREAVYLRCFEGLTFQEIGKVCSVPTFTAAGRFRLGIQKLRRLLKVNP